jgi:hypothetical protein
VSALGTGSEFTRWHGRAVNALIRSAIEHLLGERLLQQQSTDRHMRSAFLRRHINDCDGRITSIR